MIKAISSNNLLISTGYCHFNPLHHPVNVIQTSSFRHIHIHIHPLGIYLGKELNRFFQPYHQQPPLDHKDQTADGKRLLQCKLKELGVSL